MTDKTGDGGTNLLRDAGVLVLALILLMLALLLLWLWLLGLTCAGAGLGNGEVLAEWATRITVGTGRGRAGDRRGERSID